MKCLALALAALAATGCCNLDRAAATKYYQATRPELEEFYQSKGYSPEVMRIKRAKLDSMGELVEAWAE